MKLVRRKVVKAYPPTAINGLWCRRVKLACGHEQDMGNTDYDRVSRTVVCIRCSVRRDTCL
jgi:hypothetical protein